MITKNAKISEFLIWKNCVENGVAVQVLIAVCYKSRWRLASKRMMPAAIAALRDSV